MTQSAEANAQPHGTLWLLDLKQPLPTGPAPRIPVDFMRAGPEVAQELAQVMDLDDLAPVLQRFEQGRHCYIGRVGGILAAYGWVTFDEEGIGELGISIRLKPGEAYIWDCVTLPAYRGQRLYPALLTSIVAALHLQGLHRVWIGMDTDNLPSQSGAVLAGFQPIGDIIISPGFMTRRLQLRGRPSAPEPQVQAARYALLGNHEEVVLPVSPGDAISGPHQGQPLVLAGVPPERAHSAMLMVHGRGATAQDILTLTEELHQPGFAYLAPQAAGNTWYPNSFLSPIPSNEPGLSSGLAVIDFLLAQLAQVGIPAERTIILGFSQGACLSLEYVARNAQRYGGVAGLSGGLIGPEGTSRDYPGSLAGTPVFLGCSDIDPHVPKGRVEQTATVLQKLDGNVTMRLYPGMGHTVNEDELNFVRAMLAALT